MMEKNNLLNALMNANKALKGTNEELNIRAHSGKIEISGASQNLSIWSRTEGDVDDMQIAVKAASIIAALQKLPDDVIKISLTDDGLSLSGRQAKVMLPIFEFKDHARTRDFEYKVKTEHLAPYVEQVVHALDPHGFNPLMSALFLEIFENGGFQLTALDGRRYSLRNTAGKGGKKISEFVVFGKEFNEALKLLGDGEVIIYRPESGNFIQLVNEELEIQIGLAEGKYFNLNALKSTFPIHVTLKREELEAAADLVRLMSNVALIDLTATEMIIIGRDVYGETEMRIPVKSKGIDPGRTIRTAFNCQFLLDALKSISATDIMIHLKDGMNQFCITDGRYSIEMILPVRREHRH